MKTISPSVASVCCLMIFGAHTSSADAWRFLVFGDTRSTGTITDPYYNTLILPELAAEASQMTIKPAFVLVAGDLVNTGSQAAFEAWKTAIDPVYTAGIGVYPVMGNHDATDVSAFVSVFGASLPDNGPVGEVDRTYSFAHNNALVLGLDTYATPHTLNLSWVEQQLANRTENVQHVFAFGHDPAFKVSHVDCLDDDPTTRDNFWLDLTSAGGRVYFAGHDHFFDVARIDDGNQNPNDDARQFIAGTGGAPLSTDGVYNGNNGPYLPLREYHESNYGYVMVDIDGADVSMTWMQRVETGTYQAAETFTYSVPDVGAGNLELLAISCAALLLVVGVQKI